MKVHIITRANCALYSDELRQTYRLRHRVFVDELGWKALFSPDGLETDDYDDEYAVNLVAICDGLVKGCLRLLPTWRRSLLAERFSHFVSRGEVPTGRGIWEWTRWAPGTMKSPRDLVRTRAALIVGALEFAMSRDIEGFTAICNVKFLGQIEELGWKPQPLGLPTHFDEGVAVAVSWNVEPVHLANARHQFRLYGPLSIEMPAAEEPHVLRPWLVEQLMGISSREEMARVEETVIGLRSAAALPHGYASAASTVMHGRA